MVVGRMTFGWLAASGLVLSLATGCGAGASSTSQENADDLENEIVDRSSAAIKVSTPDDPNPPLPLPPTPPPPPTGLWGSSTQGYDLRIPARCSATKSYVARLRGTTCAAPASLASEWTAASVFPQATRLSVRNAYCRFTWKGTGTPPADRIAALESSISEYSVSHYDWTGSTHMPSGPDVRPECPLPVIVYQPNWPVVVKSANGGAPTQEPLAGGAAAQREVTSELGSDPPVVEPPPPPPVVPVPRTIGMKVCDVCSITDGNKAYVELPASEVRESSQTLDLTDDAGQSVGSVTFAPNAQQATATLNKTYSNPTPLTLMGASS